MAAVRRAADDADAGGDADDVAGGAAVVAAYAGGAAAPGVAVDGGAWLALHALWCDDLPRLLVQHAHLPRWKLAVATWSWAWATVLLASDDHGHCWTPHQALCYGCACDEPLQPLRPQRSSARSHPD